MLEVNPYKRIDTVDATALRRVVRERFEHPYMKDEMPLVVEEWDDSRFTPFGMWVKALPSVKVLESGGGRIDLSFRFYATGLDPKGIELKGDPHAVMQSGESLIVYALLDIDIRAKVMALCPDLESAMQRESLNLNFGGDVLSPKKSKCL